MAPAQGAIFIEPILSAQVDLTAFFFRLHFYTYIINASLSFLRCRHIEESISVMCISISVPHFPVHSKNKINIHQMKNELI